MPEIQRTKFNPPWTVAVIEAALNDVSSAKGSSESLTAALNDMRAEINSLSGGVHLKGAVDYYSDLPASTSEGDAYTVRYQGTSGTDPLGIEYAWATYQGTPQWIPIGVDPSVFAKATDEAEDRAAIVELVDNGSKNVCNMSASVFVTKTYGGVTVTRNDETINVSGTSEDLTSNFFNVYVFGTNQYNADKTIPSGQWVAMFYGSGTGVDKLSLAPVDVSTVTKGGVNEPVEFTITSDSEHNLLRMYVERNTTYDCNIKIMICSKAAWKISQTFQPYRPSWQEMYERIVALETGGNRALTMQMQQPEEQEER